MVLNNDFLAPVNKKERNWNLYNYVSCWFGMNICIPAYQIASSSISLGLSWWLSILLVLIGNSIILIPIILNSKAGVIYGIPFPVFARSVFGIRGAQIPVILRAVIGTIWTGILIWIGAKSFNLIFQVCVPNWENFKYGLFISFLIFFFLNFLLAFSGIKGIKWLENIGSPLLCIICFLLLIWACKNTMDRNLNIFEPLTRINTNGAKISLQTILSCLAANVAYYSTWALNISDLSRYAKDDRQQTLGHIIGLPLSMLLIAFIGVYVTGASEIIYGTKMWDPNDIIQQFDNKVIIIIASIGIVIASLTTNITTNILPPTIAFSNLWPKYISYKKGVIITGVLSVIVQPWKLISDPSGYIYNWLGTCGILTGPIAGILICDFYIYKRKNIDIKSLYDTDKSVYWYKKGFNIIAIVIWCISLLIVKIFEYIPYLKLLSINGWLLGFCCSFLLYIMAYSIMRKHKNL